MKKIIISLAVIGVVSAIVIGGTIAYFSDTETNSGNTFSAGTIDIAIGEENGTWNTSYDIGDLKPGETGYINFRINNVGQNPVNISKTLTNIQGDGGEIQEYYCGGAVNDMVSSEPECVIEAVDGRNDDVQTQIVYDLSVKVYTGGNDLLWWQTIYSEDDAMSIAAVYGSGGGIPVELGMIPVGGYMLVTQSYHFNPDAGNEYQGDGLTFGIEIKGEQLPQGDEGMASVTLAQKEENGGVWHIKDGGLNGLLTYKTKGPEFDYSFTASGLAEENYQLIYYPDPWSSPKTVVLIGSAMTAAEASAGVSGNVNLGIDLPDQPSDTNYPDGAKIWLVPTSSLTGFTLSWTNTDKFLFETRLIIYEDTDL